MIIYAGSLVNPALLSYKKESCAVYDSASMTLEQVIEVMKDTEARGGMTVRLHTGDPSLYGAIREQMDELDKLGIGYDVTPACPPSPARPPPFAQSIHSPRYHSRLSSPAWRAAPRARGGGAAQDGLPRLHHGAVLVHRPAGGCGTGAGGGGYAPDTPAAIVYKATWPEQRVYRCTVSTLARTARENRVTKTALITIGHFLGDDYERSKLYDPTFTHEFREASK